MADLEKDSYIYQPHTSSGRVPTEKGYVFYIENFLKDKKISTDLEKEALKNTKKIEKDKVLKIKELAKYLADKSGETVLVGFSQNHVYHTGLSNLFSKPEFRNHEIVCDISQVIDHLDEAMYDLFDRIDVEVKILIGEKNPFGSACSIILTSYQLSKKEKGLLCILGPMRMDYNSNMSLLKCVGELINKL